MSELLEAALRYASRGIHVFPVHCPVDGLCSCRDPGCHSPAKHPLTSNGLSDAALDETQVRAWWRRRTDANIGGRTGAVSGLVVLDVDGDDGYESVRALERSHDPLPRTATVVTPRGGQHIYFAHPGIEVRNSAGQLGPGLDVRGDGGYVLLPPSRGINGRRYEPDERAPIAPLPAWLLERLTERTANGKHTVTPASEWLSIVRGGVRGPDATGKSEGRNDKLTRLIGHLLRRYVDVDLVAELAHLVNEHRCKPPLSGDEVDKIIESIAGRELRRRQRTAA